MSTQTLNDIHKDLKLLVTAITGFKDGDEIFRRCEHFALTNIRHHRYLSVDGNAIKRDLENITEKFSIQGKFEVAKEFKNLVETFLTSFDFEKHPQSDLQWSLLSLLLNLAKETNTSDVKNLSSSAVGEASISAEHDIDWAKYLRENEQEFFNDYGGSSSSSCSDDELSDNNEKKGAAAVMKQSASTTQESSGASPSNLLLAVTKITRGPSTCEKLSECLAQAVESQRWLDNNIQKPWWNLPELRCSQTDSQFRDAHMCEIWNRSNLQEMSPSNSGFSGTLSEYQALREIIWMFSVPSEMVIFQKTPEGHFRVRDNISIPSLTPNAFKSLLTEYCQYFEIIDEMSNFGGNFYKHYHPSNGTSTLPSLTYQTYDSVILQHLGQFSLELLEIEKKVMKQDDVYTLLTLSRDLKPHLKRLKMIYEIHRAVTIDWKKFPNWTCATKLISGLYEQMENSSSPEQANLCASIYFSSVTVYLNIMEAWFSVGRLDDYRNEFIATRITDVQFQPEISSAILPAINVAEEKKHENFIIRQLDDACLEDPVINILCCKAKPIGRSIDLLVTLDRISDMWNMNVECDAARVSFNDEFLNEITLEFSKYSYSNTIDTTDAIALPELKTEPQDTIDENIFDPELDDNILQQLTSINNPFLMKAFEDYLPPMKCRKNKHNNVNKEDTTDGKVESSPIGCGRDIFCELQRISPTAILPFRKVLENTLEKLIDKRYSCASKLVKNILINEYKLETHLKLMRSIYMMERGDLMTQFYRLMFNEIESTVDLSMIIYCNGGMSVENSLTLILQQVLAEEWPDASSNWSITIEGTAVWGRHKVLQAVEHLSLNYSIGWPINMILNEKSVVKYNAVFCFQLRLKWALWTLNNLRFGDLEEKDKKFESSMNDQIRHFNARRLESLRFWMVHAIGSIHAYITGEVFQGFGIALDQLLAEADNLDTIIAAHNQYLEKVDEHSLLTPEYEDLMLTINNLLRMCVDVRQKWKSGASALSSSDLDFMEKCYTKYHTYIALALHNAVQHKDADYQKLTPSVCTASGIEAERTLEHSDKTNDECNTGSLVTDLSRDLLTEVAHQSLPPSGIPIPIPTLVQKTCNYYLMDNCMEPQLPEYVSLNQYDQIFSCIRWHHYEQHVPALNHSSYDLSIQLAQFISENSEEDFQLENK